LSPAPLVLTRPAAQADEWAAALRAAGLTVQCFPLLSTTADAAVCAQAWSLWAQADAAFFSSPAAVHALGDGPWASLPCAVCVGPGTAAALRRAGARHLITPPPEAGQFDSEQLWPLIEEAGPWQGRHWLWLRGDGGRDWLLERLREAGARLTPLSVYRRAPALLDPDALQRLLAGPALWLLSSSEALDHLLASAPPGTDWTRVQALATHPRIEQRASRAGLRVRSVRPLLPEVAEAWRHWVRISSHD
jgi:uroporphyrinogen-III synthase